MQWMGSCITSIAGFFTWDSYNHGFVVLPSCLNLAVVHGQSSPTGFPHLMWTFYFTTAFTPGSLPCNQLLVCMLEDASLWYLSPFLCWFSIQAFVPSALNSIVVDLGIHQLYCLMCWNWWWPLWTPCRQSTVRLVVGRPGNVPSNWLGYAVIPVWLQVCAWTRCLVTPLWLCFHSFSLVLKLLCILFSTLGSIVPNLLLP